MKVLFLDESGDHNLSKIDPDYPVFVLGGVIMDKDYADGPLTRALKDFKQEMFGHSDIVLHTADITRNRNGFEALKDRGQPPLRSDRPTRQEVSAFGCIPSRGRVNFRQEIKKGKSKNEHTSPVACHRLGLLVFRALRRPERKG